MSPFGRSKRPAPTDEERRAVEVDLERIRQGGIPLGAEQRLKRLSTASTPFFTSDLSAKEYALAQASGLRPIAQVMGSSVVQRSWLQNQGVTLANRGASLANRARDFGAEQLSNQGFNLNNQGWAGANQGWSVGGQSPNMGYQGLYFSSGEIKSLAEPWNIARNRAFNRLGEEASLAAADGVIGIEMSTDSAHESGNIELVVFGTAVRDSVPSEWPYLSMCTLSGQDVDKLRRVGASPRGVVGHTVVYSVQLGSDSAWVMNAGSGLFGGAGARANVEISEIAQGVYDARDRVMLEVRRQGNDLGANCVVVSMLRHTIDHYEYEQNGYKYHYFHVTMHLLGTAIEVGARDPYPTGLSQPMMSINLGS